MHRKIDYRIGYRVDNVKLKVEYTLALIVANLATKANN